MGVDPKYLRLVQGAGWNLRAIDMESVIAACPRAGCSVKIRLKEWATVPTTCKSGSDITQIELTSYDDARCFLRSRREDLALSIHEVEELTGAATDHLAKAEKDDPDRIPNVNLLIEWAAAIGYKVVLVPGELPPLTLRYIHDTRAKSDRRNARRSLYRDKRAGRVQRGSNSRR